MNPWVAVRHGLPLTFLSVACSTLFAAVYTLPTALELEHLPGSLRAHGILRVAAVEGLLSLLPALRAQAVSVALGALGYALLTPWLHMAWLAALASPTSPWAALAAGARLAPRAVVTSLWVALGCLLLLAPWPLAAWATRDWLGSHTHQRMHDLTTLLLLLPCLPITYFGLAWHDLARARCLRSDAGPSARLGFGDATRAGALGSYGVWTSLGLLPVLAAQVAAWQLTSTFGFGGLVTLALFQAAALTRGVSRSRWLAHALRCTDSTTP